MRAHPLLRPPKRPITLRQTCPETPTAGFGYEFRPDPMWVRLCEATNNPFNVHWQAPALRLPLSSNPCDRWNTASTSNWAGRALERSRNSRAFCLVRDKIFAPLGRNRTEYAISSDSSLDSYKRHQRKAYDPP